MDQQKNAISKRKQVLLVAAGSVSLALGIAGIALPLLPTTPFLLLSSGLFLRSSERHYRWLMDHPIYGKYIRNYREHRALPLRAKVITLGMLWVTILSSIFLATDNLIVRILLGGIAIGVSVHILRMKTLEEAG